MIVVLAALLGAGCGKKGQDKNGENGIPVGVTRVRVENQPLFVHAAGRVFPKTQVNLSFKTGGLIGRITADEGQRVRRGQVLAELDLSEVQAYAEQARQGMEKAQRDLKRIESLYRDKAATQELLENARTAFQVARSTREIAEFNLKHSRIEAPQDGRILKRLAEAREMVGPGMPVFVFAGGSDQWILRSGVTDRDIMKLKLGDEAAVAIDALGSDRYTGFVSEIADAVNPASGTYEIELSLQAEKRMLKAGFFATAEIRTGVSENVAIIPMEAMVEGDGLSAVVYTADRAVGRARLRRVVIREIGNSTLTVTGLADGEELVINGASYLSDGASIRIERTPAAAGGDR
jgi:RND family efflux transporter MFP subunit